VSGLSLTIIFLMSRFRFILRPHLLTFVFFSMLIYLLEVFQTTNEQRTLYWLPVITAVWSNFHSGCVWGLMFLDIYLVSNFISQRFGLNLKAEFPREKLRFVFGVILLSHLTSFCNPTGFGYLSYVFKHPELARTMGISELQAPTIEAFSLFWVYLFTLGLMIIFKSKNCTIFQLSVFGIFALLAAKFCRFIPLFGISTCVIFTDKLNYWLGKIVKKPVLEKQYSALFFLSILLLIGFTKRNEVGLGPNERLFPVKAADFILKENLPGKMYNKNAFGGYLVWKLYPQRKVFSDGKMPLYEDLNEKFKQAKDYQGLEKIFEEYNINFSIVDYNPALVNRYFMENSQWVLIYWDDTALIYLKNLPANLPFIKKHNLNYVNPLKSAQIPPEQISFVTKKLEERINADPDCVLAYRFLASLYQRRNQMDKALEQYKKSIQLNPNNAQDYFNAGTIYAVKGEYKKAEKFFRQAIKLNRSYSDAYNNLGIVYAQKGLLKKARGCWQKALKLNPANQSAVVNMRRLKFWRDE